MKKNVLLYSSVWLFVCMLCSCASVPAPQQETTFEQELFSPAYIAVRGYGQSGQDAEQNALAALSRYFSSHVTVETAQKTVVKDTASYSLFLPFTHRQNANPMHLNERFCMDRHNECYTITQH